MSIKNLLKVAITAILSNKFRSFLSMLGIIIGVAAVIIMMAIGQGSKQSVREELSKMGTNLLTLRPGADRRGGVRRDPSSMQTLKMADYQSLISDATLITHISPEVTSSGQVIHGANNSTWKEPHNIHLLISKTSCKKQHHPPSSSTSAAATTRFSP